MAASFALLIIALVIPGCDHGAKAPSAVNLKEVRYFDVSSFPAEQQEMVAIINQHEKALNGRDEAAYLASYASTWSENTPSQPMISIPGSRSLCMVT